MAKVKKVSKKKSEQAPPPRPRICNRCGSENSHTAVTCSSCGSGRFAPSWVIAKRPINRQFGIEITETDPQYGDVERRLTLSKWWPGGNATFHIPNAAQWNAVENIINNQLAPILGWRARREIVQEIRKKKKSDAETAADIKKLLKDYPDFLKQVVGAIDLKKLNNQDIENVVEVMGQLTEALSGLGSGFKEAFLAVVKKLPAQPKRALEDLEELLSSWSLQQITSVTQQVHQRVETIELFKNRIIDPRTYEIRGADSIHKILERAMWLIDERYWLLESNQNLKTLIGDRMAKDDKKKFGKQRPDCACGTVGDKLLIIEIKRPSHTLEIDDLNQLETYITLAEEYLKFRSSEGYLIGNRKSDDLMRRLRHRTGFQVWTYSDLLDATEQRYKSYLEGIGSSQG